MLLGSVIWQGGFVQRAGNAEARSRHGVGTTPALRWPRQPFGSGPFSVIEKTITLAAGGSTHVDLATEPDALNRAASFSRLVGIELFVTSDTGVVRFGPQGQSNAAQLFFGGVATADRIDVHDTFAWLGRHDGLPLTAPNTRLWFSNPGPAPVSFWLRAIGRTG